MRVEVFGKAIIGDPIVQVRLVQQSDGVLLEAVDERGNRIHRGSLLVIGSNGTLQRSPNVNNNLGFRLNDAGQIKTEGDC